MRMLSLALSFAFLLAAIVPQGAVASTLSEKTIDEVFDRLQYSLNVEWDQKDESMLNIIKNEFETNLKASGLTTLELEDFMMNKLLSGEAKVEYSRMMSAVKNQNLTEEQATQLAMSFILKNYKDGAHFYGKGGPMGGGHHKWILCAVIVVVIVKVCLSGSNGGNSDHGGHGGHGGHWNDHPSYQY